MIKDFEFNDKDLKIYNQEIKNFIPDRIIDNHIHSWEKDNIDNKFSFESYKVDKPFTDLDLVDEFKFLDFREYTNTAFPGKEYEGVFFGLPFPYIDIKRNNEYIIEESKKNNFKFMYMPLPKENIWDTNEKIQLLENKNFFGFKPYPDLCGAKDNEISIFDFVNKSILEFSNENELFILLHLPRKKRLNSAKNIKEISEILTKYKKLRIILAHAGRSYHIKDILNNLDILNKFDNLFFDLALVTEVSVIEYLIKKVNTNNIFYGSDYPWLLIKGRDVCINDNHYYITHKPYDWSLGPNEGLKTDFTLYIYEQIRSLIYAVKSIKPRSLYSFMEKIFYDNLKYFLDVDKK